MTAKPDKTNVMRLLDLKGISYEIYTYQGGALSAGDVAAAVNQNPAAVFKTLVTVSKANVHYVFMVPALAELDLKKAAKAVGEKALEMLPQKMLLPLTGYVHGGCSPIGMKKPLPTFIHETAPDISTLFFSAGKVGVQVALAYEDLYRMLPVVALDIIKNT